MPKSQPAPSLDKLFSRRRVAELHPVTAKGSFVGPLEDAFGNTKAGLTLETTIDRSKFGLNWNAELPAGGFALSNDVKLTVELHLVKA